MTTLRKAARDVLIVAGSQLVMWVASFGFVLAQARYLGPARFGELSLALTYAAFLSIVIDFGLGTQLSRMVAQRSTSANTALVTTMIIRAGLWLVAAPAAWLAAVALGYDRELQQLILILAASVLFLGMGNTIGAYFQGQERFVLPSVASIAQRVTAAVVGVVALVATHDLIAVTMAFVVAAIVNVGVLLYGMRFAPRAWPRVQLDEVIRLFRGAIPLGMVWIATTFYFGVDMVMLQRMAPAENVGWYAAAYRLFNAASIVPTIVAGTVLYPVLSRLSLGSRSELRVVIEKSLSFLTLSGVGVALVFVVLADPIVALLYPAQSYAPAASALRLLAPGLVFLYLNWVFAASLLGLHREKQLLVLTFAAAVLNPLANLVAIPLFRQEGAALTTSLTELLMLVWLVRTMPRDLVSSENLRVAAKAALAAGAAALGVLATQEATLLVALPLAIALYGITALALRAVQPRDLLALLSVLRPDRTASNGVGEVVGEPILRAATEEVR